MYFSFANTLPFSVFHFLFLHARAIFKHGKQNELVMLYSFEQTKQIGNTVFIHYSYYINYFFVCFYCMFIFFFFFILVVSKTIFYLFVLFVPFFSFLNFHFFYSFFVLIPGFFQPFSSRFAIAAAFLVLHLFLFLM